MADRDCITQLKREWTEAHPGVTEANELLRTLNREVFNDSIDIAKLPHAVGLVMDFAAAAVLESRRAPEPEGTLCPDCGKNMECPACMKNS